MPALKEIGKLASRPGLSLISQAKFWHQDVYEIAPAQLLAFVTRHKADGRFDEVETSVELVLQEIQMAIARNEITVPPLLSYN